MTLAFVTAFCIIPLLLLAIDTARTKRR